MSDLYEKGQRIQYTGGVYDDIEVGQTGEVIAVFTFATSYVYDVELDGLPGIYPMKVDEVEALDD